MNHGANSSKIQKGRRRRGRRRKKPVPKEVIMAKKKKKKKRIRIKAKVAFFVKSKSCSDELWSLGFCVLGRKKQTGLSMVTVASRYVPKKTLDFSFPGKKKRGNNEKVMGRKGNCALPPPPPRCQVSTPRISFCVGGRVERFLPLPRFLLFLREKVTTLSFA